MWLVWQRVVSCGLADSHHLDELWTHDVLEYTTSGLCFLYSVKWASGRGWSATGCLIVCERVFDLHELGLPTYSSSELFTKPSLSCLVGILGREMSSNITHKNCRVLRNGKTNIYCSFSQCLPSLTFTLNVRKIVLGGVTFSVLAIPPKVRWLKPGQGWWILRAIKPAARLPSERE